MNNKQSFTLTPAMADQLVQPFTDHQLRNFTILDPAGSGGEVADAVNRKSGYFEHNWHREQLFVRLDCVEPSAHFRKKLEEKKHTVINASFLGYRPDTRYDCIMMNPPIAEATAYLLHAYDILPHGYITAVMPSTLFEGPVTPESEAVRALERLEVSEFDDAGNVGGREALRPVKVCVFKPCPDVTFELFGEVVGPHAKPERPEQNLTDRDKVRETVRELVQSYHRALAAWDRQAPVMLEYLFYQHLVSGGNPDGFGHGHKSIVEDHNAVVRELKEKAWANVFRLTRIEESMSYYTRESFYPRRKELSRVDFTEANVLGLLHTLRTSWPDIARASLVEAFENLTYDHENREPAYGFRTADAFRVKRKAIVHVLSHYSDHKPDLSTNGHRILTDLDRAVANLEGKRLGDIRTIEQAFDDMRNKDEHLSNWSGKNFESEYFKCSCYKKGTIYLYFKDEGLWELFNAEAARGKNWLPDAEPEASETASDAPEAEQVDEPEAEETEEESPSDERDLTDDELVELYAAMEDAASVQADGETPMDIDPFRLALPEGESEDTQDQEDATPASEIAEPKGQSQTVRRGFMNR